MAGNISRLPSPNLLSLKSFQVNDSSIIVNLAHLNHICRYLIFSHEQFIHSHRGRFPPVDQGSGDRKSGQCRPEKAGRRKRQPVAQPERDRRLPGHLPGDPDRLDAAGPSISQGQWPGLLPAIRRTRICQKPSSTTDRHLITPKDN